jgi:dethiobiotin synthetase
MHKTNKGFAVIGTDTGVGKTMLTALLCLAAQQAGVDWVPMKPVQTGGIRLPDGRLTAPDLDWILKVLGMVPSPQDLIRMNPYVLDYAASPHLAAELEGITIDRNRILHSYQELAAGHDGVVVEGAGGLLVPFGRDWMLADLLVDLHLPVIVVARAGLGTLNHTLLTLEALRTRGLSVAGVVLNQLTPQVPGVIEADNVKVLTEIGGAPVWGTMPYWDGLDDEIELVILRCRLMERIPELTRQVSRYLLP